MKLKWLAAIMAAIYVIPATAAEFREYPDLPSQQVVQQVLQNYPSVLAAQYGIKAGEAARDRLEAGSHELNLTGGAARRRIRETGENLRDWNVGLERALRLPRKAELDAALGQQNVALAQNGYGDAMHEAGRKLLSGWFTWLRERSSSEQWLQQVEVLKQQLEVVTRRVKAGDASPLEEDVARAALMQAEIELQQVKLRADNATASLMRYFPSLPLPPRLPAGEPQPLPQDLAYWLDLALDHNHELLLARAESRIARLSAQRADADRIPDPTVGLHYISERNGSDSITGVSVTIPLPGGARRAASAEAASRADMATQREALVLRRIEADITAAYNRAKASYASWQSATAASGLMQRNADKMARAYDLGESGLNDVLLARRQAMDARLAAVLAQLESSESLYRLLLDTHQLWRLGSEASEGHH
ncbi:MAG: TolC family protein [Sulfurimicrobium sp.]